MEGVVDNLRAFNRKERFFLIGLALGNQDFTLSEAFRRQLNETFHLQVPEDAFAAMDYHLEWLYASLSLASRGVVLSAKGAASEPCLNTEKIIKGNQEDLDFLVAYQAKDGCHIVLLEAKAYTGWNNKQMCCKAARLGAIFGDDGNRWQSVVPHFAIISPRKPIHLEHQDWPAWMSAKGPVWIPISLPPGRYKVTRCEPRGKQNEHGGYWRAQPSHREGAARPRGPARR